jgi:hypothetical protein
MEQLYCTIRKPCQVNFAAIGYRKPELWSITLLDRGVVP